MRVSQPTSKQNRLNELACVPGTAELIILSTGEFEIASPPFSFAGTFFLPFVPIMGAKVPVMIAGTM